MNKVIKVLIVITALTAGCEEIITEGGIEPTINFQEGTIEGIKTGDDTTTVLQKLGRPDWIRSGDVDGFYYEYADRRQLTQEMISVFFMNRDYNHFPGDYRVAVINVLNNYDGKSKEGIRIGTLKYIVVKKLGNPDLVQPDYNYEHYYFIRSDSLINVASFLYDENFKIKIISIFTRNN
ncbi:MAG: hypothetical protein HXY50_04670 [Ignavibacteriaceae bacterium]|nr:hypothetical protein [Ignavibacteriaceae bacterium]